MFFFSIKNRVVFTFTHFRNIYHLDLKDHNKLYFFNINKSPFFYIPRL